MSIGGARYLLGPHASYSLGKRESKEGHGPLEGEDDSDDVGENTVLKMINDEDAKPQQTGSYKGLCEE